MTLALAIALVVALFALWVYIDYLWHTRQRCPQCMRQDYGLCSWVCRQCYTVTPNDSNFPGKCPECSSRYLHPFRWECNECGRVWLDPGLHDVFTQAELNHAIDNEAANKRARSERTTPGV